MDFSALRKLVHGTVIDPSHALYDESRKVFIGGVDRKPLAILEASSASDISEAVKYCSIQKIPLSVKGGGHSNAGYGVMDNALVVDMSRLKGLIIDENNETAWAESGLTAREYVQEKHTHGLTTGFGDTGSVGIGGLTLGGGIGYLVRKYGLTIDNLLAAQVVTADGTIHEVSDEREPDLFWAIRGAGANFGIVTKFHFRLYPLTNVLGGMLVLPATPQSIASFIHMAHRAPNELSSIANIITAPPMPFLPKETVGKLIIMAMLCWCGDSREGNEVIDQFRTIATPLADMVKQIPYPEMYPPDNETYHPIAAGRTMFLDSVDESVAQRILDHLGKATGNLAVCQLRVLGGKMAEIPTPATAFAHRKSSIMANLATLYQNPQEKPTHEAWVQRFMEDIQQSYRGAYVNFLADEPLERVQAAYPGETWQKLTAIKKTYDPQNIFRFNQNIPPTSLK